MFVLRVTHKLRKTLPLTAHGEDRSDTALGDWYVNRFVLDRQPLLVLASANSLLTILTPARGVKNLPNRLGELVADRLERRGFDQILIDREVAAMQQAAIGPTRDRSVLGHMVECAKTTAFLIPVGGLSTRELRRVEDDLYESPWRCGRGDDQVILAERATAQLLKERWG